MPAIHLADKFNPIWWFGNTDEPNPPGWYLPGHEFREFKWRLRNPFHNFGNYIIGFVDKETARSGRYPDLIGNPNGGWNFTIIKCKRLRLIFVDYKYGRFEFYFGWRERGNFGIKLNFRKKK
jgi:hypothetical protein